MENVLNFYEKNRKPNRIHFNLYIVLYSEMNDSVSMLN